MRVQRIKRALTALFTAGALFFTSANLARADTVLVLSGHPAVGMSGTWTYSVILPSTSELDGTGGFGNTSNFFTLYSIPGYVPGSVTMSPSLAALFGVVTEQPTGDVPATQMDHSVPELLNLTFHYTLGAEVEFPEGGPPTTLGSFSFVSTGVYEPFPSSLIYYSGANQRNTPVSDPMNDELLANSTGQVLGPVDVPEPASLGLVLSGLSVVAVGLSRRSRSRKPV